MPNFEKMEPIVAENVETHEKELKKRLQLIQLDFADIKFSEEKKSNPDLKFLDIIKKYTAFEKNIANEYQRRCSIGKEEFEKIQASILEEINKIYENGGKEWKEEAVNFITEKVELLGPFNFNDSEPGKEKAGIINYKLEKGKLGFEKFGIDEEDSFINVHFDEVYLQKEKVGKKKLIESLERLAKDIVEKYPETQYVVGRSWILDNPLAERLGFEIVEREASLDHTSTWWQLMDRNGQINEKKKSELLREGALPSQVALGLIKVEEFLKRYLPNEMRGSIKLKKIKEEDKEKLKMLRDQSKIFGERFEQMSKEEILFFFKQLPFLGENFEKDDIKELLDFFYEVKDNGSKWENVAKDYPERIKKLKAVAEKYMPKPAEEEVIIEPKNK